MIEIIKKIYIYIKHPKPKPNVHKTVHTRSLKYPPKKKL